ncbi:MAG TPA: extracellular solute-binding protein [Actinomycetota bacterium]
MADQGRQVTVQYVGAGPDVFTPDGPWVGEFAQAGFLKPLDEVVGSEVNDWDGWSQIPKPVAGIVEFEGKRYGIPVGTDGRVLFFNKRLFAKAGPARGLAAQELGRGPSGRPPAEGPAPRRDRAADQRGHGHGRGHHRPGVHPPAVRHRQEPRRRRQVARRHPRDQAVLGSCGR